jgi:GNAT superfamily N-acetyltransferase
VTPPGLNILPLTETKGHIPTLVRWFEAEWAPWYGPGGDGDARHDLDSAARHSGMPFAVIALDDSGKPLGTASLRADSVGADQAPGPWLAAILVDPAHRGQGVGTALVAAIEDATARFGYPEIYTSTDTAAGIMARRGWQPMGTAQSLRGDVAIFRKSLTPPGPAS